MQYAATAKDGVKHNFETVHFEAAVRTRVYFVPAHDLIILDLSIIIKSVEIHDGSAARIYKKFFLQDISLEIFKNNSQFVHLRT